MELSEERIDYMKTMRVVFQTWKRTRNECDKLESSLCSDFVSLYIHEKTPRNIVAKMRFYGDFVITVVFRSKNIP